MIKYYLYTKEGKILLSSVSDIQQAYLLEQYYNEIYNNKDFKVTIKRPYKKEEYVIGFL